MSDLAASSVRERPRSDSAPTTARRPRRGPDRVTVALLSLSAFLIVLALLGTQLSVAGSKDAPSRALLVRRIYRTTVIERVLPAGARAPAGGTSVTQSVSGSGAEPALPATPVTRTS